MKITFMELIICVLLLFVGVIVVKTSPRLKDCKLEDLTVLAGACFCVMTALAYLSAFLMVIE